MTAQSAICGTFICVSCIHDILNRLYFGISRIIFLLVYDNLLGRVLILTHLDEYRLN